MGVWKFKHFMLISFFFYSNTSVRCEPVYDYGKTKPEPIMESNHICYHNMPGNMRLTTNLSKTNVQEHRYFVLSNEKHLVLTCGQPLEAGLEITCNAFLSKTVNYWRNWVKGMRIPRDYQEHVGADRSESNADRRSILPSPFPRFFFK